MPETLNQKSEKEQLEIAKQLGTTRGFIDYYFKNLPNFTTRSECFRSVNLEYHQLFREYRFSDYDSFRQVLKYHLKPKK